MIAAVRVRGNVGESKKNENVLETLKLRKRHNCTVYPERKDIKKALLKVQDTITFGEIDKDTLSKLLEKRSNLREILDKLDLDGSEDAAESLIDGDLKIKELESKGLNTPFRLSPPSKGFSGVKTQYTEGGSLGERREDINDLLNRMI